MSDCINLRERLGHRFRVAMEESHGKVSGKQGRAGDPWLQIIPCRNGHISPYGGEELAACTKARGQIAKRILDEVQSAVMWQDGQDGCNIRFHVSDFDAVASVMVPHKRRVGSPQAAERLSAYRFRPKQDAEAG